MSETVRMTSIEAATINHITDYPYEYRENYPNVKQLIKRSATKNCNRNLILNRLPIVKWLPKYNLNYLLQDFVAGLTVGLTAIPQGIAYAVVAGLEPQYGLYSGFMGCFVYFILGSCKDITIGPTAIMALMIQKYVSDNADYAILAAFLSGLVILALGLLNLGFLVQFISQPVTIGFTSAAAVTIACSQIKSLLGLPGTSNDFIDAWANVFYYIGETKLWDTLLGIATIIFLLILQKCGDIKGKFRPIFRYISLARNAFAVFIGTAIAYGLTDDNGNAPFALTGNVASGFPPFKLPPFETTIGNETIPFDGMISNLGTSLIAIPMIAIMESIAIAKAFSKGKTVDATQEMIALGVCNILGSFFSSMPTTGSFTRTAVNNASGVQTTLGGLFTGGLILLSLGLLTEIFRYIPKTTLAAVIITAMFFMVDFKGMRDIWRTRRMDILPLIGALIACLLLGLEYGILIGVTFNIIYVLYSTSRPNIEIYVKTVYNHDILMIIPDQSLVFSSAENVKYKILKNSQIHNEINFMVVNGQYIQTIDSTVAKNLQTCANDLRLQNKRIVFWNFKHQPTGVAWRLSKEFGTLFYQTNTIEELLELNCIKTGLTTNVMPANGHNNNNNV